MELNSIKLEFFQILIVIIEDQLIIMVDNRKYYPLKLVGEYFYSLQRSQIGSSTKSIVYKGQHLLRNNQVAIKVIPINSMSDYMTKKLMEQEIKIMSKLKQCSNIVRMIDSYQTTKNVYIVMELCTGGDLDNYLLNQNENKLNQTQAIRIITQIIEGYKHLYQNKIIHRDLKLANIFITQPNSRQCVSVKIADFGYSMICSSMTNCLMKTTQNVGSPAYMAPQSLNKNIYSYKSDIWALGIMYYEMLYGQVPFIAKSQKQLSKILEQQSIDKRQMSQISEVSRQFIKKCLKNDISQRFEPYELIDFKFEKTQDTYIQNKQNESQDNINLKFENDSVTTSPKKQEQNYDEQYRKKNSNNFQGLYENLKLNQRISDCDEQKNSQNKIINNKYIQKLCSEKENFKTLSKLH